MFCPPKPKLFVMTISQRTSRVGSIRLNASRVLSGPMGYPDGSIRIAPTTLEVSRSLSDGTASPPHHDRPHNCGSHNTCCPVTVMIFIGDPVYLPALSGVAPVAAVAIVFRSLRKGVASLTRIEVDRPAEVPVVPLVLDRKCFVASLKQVSGATVPLGVPVGIAGEPVLHPSETLRRDTRFVEDLGF